MSLVYGSVRFVVKESKLDQYKKRDTASYQVQAAVKSATLPFIVCNETTTKKVPCFTYIQYVDIKLVYFLETCFIRKKGGWGGY